MTEIRLSLPMSPSVPAARLKGAAAILRTLAGIAEKGRRAGIAEKGKKAA